MEKECTACKGTGIYEPAKLKTCYRCDGTKVDPEVSEKEAKERAIQKQLKRPGIYGGFTEKETRQALNYLLFGQSMRLELNPWLAQISKEEFARFWGLAKKLYTNDSHYKTLKGGQVAVVMKELKRVRRLLHTN